MRNGMAKEWEVKVPIAGVARMVVEASSASRAIEKVVHETDIGNYFVGKCSADGVEITKLEAFEALTEIPVHAKTPIRWFDFDKAVAH